MKKLNSIIFCLLISFTAFGQYEYEPSSEFPFGRYNANAPEEIKDYQDLIGECNCTSTAKKPDGTWSEPVNMMWRFKYIMNGTAVQDETLKADGIHTGSIRQFNTDSSKWYVNYYTAKAISPKLKSWNGIKSNDKIVLYKEHKAPNGMDGFYRLTFYDMSETGYKWVGEWVDKTETVVFPTWKIECLKK